MLEGIIPGATGESGIILAIPPYEAHRRRWTYRVDGCGCTRGGGDGDQRLRTHALIAEAERCSQEVRRRATKKAALRSALKLLRTVAPSLLSAEAKAPL